MKNPAMTNNRRFALSSCISILTALILTCFGCEKDQNGQLIQSSFLDTQITQLHGLGWLGARSHPLMDSVSFADPDDADKTVSPGGIVIADLNAGLPISKTGIQRGDVIVRISEDWVPIKEDPTLDVIAMIESQIAANKTSISIGFLRDGHYQVASLEPTVISIDEGLPLATQRSIDASFNTLRHLAELQQNDGSFVAEPENAAHQLMTTSIAGLAFLSADPSVRLEFKPNIDGCLDFLARQLETDDLEIDALTSAYIVLFFAESNVDLMDEDWLDKVVRLTSVFSETQHESGGWNVSVVSVEAMTADVEEDSDKTIPESVDVMGTYTTNQVLLAIGALERKGMSGENEVIEKACNYLNRQSALRIPSSIDRRVKAALSAGTAAALIALNCDRSDLDLRQLLKNGLDRAHDMYTSPALGLPGMLHTSIAARQMGSESWIQFHNASKYLLLSLQNPDGSVGVYPDLNRQPLDFENEVDSIVWRTAHIALIQSVQMLSLRKILAIDQDPMMAARDITGKKVEGVSASSGPGQGIQMIQLDGANAADSEELTKLIMEQLKEQGVDVDKSKLKIQKSSKQAEDDE